VWSGGGKAQYSGKGSSSKGAGDALPAEKMKEEGKREGLSDELEKRG